MMKISKQSVQLVDNMGTDLSVVNAARVSFDKQSDWEYEYESHIHFAEQVLSEKDKKLIKYLAEHNHWSPFSHTSVSLRVKAPIFVARQLAKHKVGGAWNEVSRRYVDSDLEFYVPEMWRKKAENVKQGSSKEEVKLDHKTGSCLYCGHPLSGKRTKFCCDAHQVYHSQLRLPYNTKFNRWKATAKANNIPFELSIDDLDWPRLCPYLNIELNYTSDNRADDVASLDKIIPELGYIKGNVQIISSLANKMKSSATKEQILLFSKNSLLMHGGVFVDHSSSYETYLEEISKTYYNLIDSGVCAEQARMMLPQSLMTTWIWTGSVYFFSRVCNLRLDPHAQLEVQEVAKLISDTIRPLYPESWKVLVDDKQKT